MQRPGPAVLVVFALVLVGMLGRSLLPQPWSTPFAVLQPAALVIGLLLLIRQQKPDAKRFLLWVAHYLLAILALVSAATLALTIWLGVYKALPVSAISLAVVIGLSLLARRLALRP